MVKHPLRFAETPAPLTNGLSVHQALFSTAMQDYSPGSYREYTKGSVMKQNRQRNLKLNFHEFQISG